MQNEFLERLQQKGNKYHKMIDSMPAQKNWDDNKVKEFERIQQEALDHIDIGIMMASKMASMQ